MATKICCIVYKKLTELAKKAIARIEDEELTITLLETFHDNLREDVGRTQQEEADIYIASGANYVVFLETYCYPVVEIAPDFVDYIRALQEAAKISTDIAIVVFRKAPSYPVHLLEDMMDINIEIIVYEEKQDLEEKLRQSTCTVVIGGSLANEIAVTLNKDSLLIYPGEEEIINAIFKAKTIAQELKRSKEHNQLVQAVIDYSPNGILSVDSAGIISSYNYMAEKLLGMKAPKARGRKADELFPELQMESILSGDFRETNAIIECNGKELYLSRLRLVNQGQATSAIAFLSDASSLKKAELRFIEQRHNELHARGLHAKYQFSDILAGSKMVSVVEQAKLYAQSSHNILILGETGVGKELFAQSIHNHSMVKDQSFLAINCAALPENLLESELFGYNEGAFTGSKKGGKKGFFELADKGTLFLDEIGEIPVSLQMRLLRVLQEKEIMRIGDDRIIPINVRIIAATNKMPRRMIQDGFRQDLLYRLNVLELEIPPLRERGNDVVRLFKQLMKKSMNEYQSNFELPEAIFKVLTCYSWPGNIRELENVCSRFSLIVTKHQGKSSIQALKRILCKCIGEEYFIQDMFRQFRYEKDKQGKQDVPKEMIASLKDNLGYNNDELASILGMSRTSLWRQRQEHISS